MGGFGSGRNGGRVLVENAIRLNIDTLLRRCRIRRGGTARGTYHFDFYDQELSVDFECHIGNPGAVGCGFSTEFAIIAPESRMTLMS